MRILAAFAVAVSLLQPVQQASVNATPAQAGGVQTPAAQVPAAQVAAGQSSKVWIGRYEEFEKFLQTAPIKQTKEIGTGVTIPRRAYFAPGGLAESAIVKNIDEGVMKSYLDRYASEIAAYRLDRLLELDMVPPTVERSVNGETCSVQLWVENCRQLKQVEKESKADVDLWNEQVYRHRVFDDLIINIDRNSGNMLIDPLWNLILIDHSRAFDARKSKMPFELTKIDRPLFERLKKLDKKTLQAQLRNYVTFGVDPILQQRDRIVKEFEKLIAKNGEANVLIEWRPLPAAPTVPGATR
jgi:hypothetical protein